MNSRAIDALLFLGSAASIVLISALITYSIQNDSGHTGMNPYEGLCLFVPVTLAGIIRLVRFRETPKWLALAALITGALGIGLLVYFDVTNTLLQYEVWIHRGMP